KIEPGPVMVAVADLRLDDLHQYVERPFRHIAEAKGVSFDIRLDKRLPKGIVTDVKRLQQILKNLMSNAFKFTHRGQVTLSIESVQAGWDAAYVELNRASEVLALSVRGRG